METTFWTRPLMSQIFWITFQKEVVLSLWGKRIETVTWHFTIFALRALLESPIIAKKKKKCNRYFTHFSKLILQEWENRPYTPLMRAEPVFQYFLLAMRQPEYRWTKDRADQGWEWKWGTEVQKCQQMWTVVFCIRQTGNQCGFPTFSAFVNSQQLHQPGIWHNWGYAFLISTQIPLNLNSILILVLLSQKVAPSLPYLAWALKARKFWL